ncbi:enoyl-CoA hydratase/isomerase family protein [Advenella mimigardefordensis]|uniref:Putative enoyl-CoA hydratase/isomerase n=1 Tax=Advenella mimigardefordensis (strain DSM 17166 / LMG 22922 / DPN7) TaxID=1247726 RepID=W0PIG6_ADVMD|nr:enoyl-CoA hydratase/isomerase family protein [Advenella mimigardefordensis]AHG64718.1 putative enoyl-CoA hydratase/isomerase [Advenella mimigardefordensis DPN7]
MSDMLSIEQREQAWVFTLNRPEKMNALAPELVLALTEGIQAAHQQKIPLMIFKGNGKNFCAGFDFSDLDTASEGDLLQRIIQIEIMLDLLATSPSMTIALCHGRNFGAGVDIIAACKHRIAAAGTSFRFPGIKFGLILGTRRFQNIVGTQNALEILSSTRTFDAQEAQKIAFMQEIREPEQWPSLIEQAEQNNAILSDVTRRNLYKVLYCSAESDQNLAALVRSASAPGLKDRIRAYLKPN